MFHSMMCFALSHCSELMYVCMFYSTFVELRLWPVSFLINEYVYVMCYVMLCIYRFYCDKTCYLVYYYSKSPNMTLLLNKQYRAYI